MKGLKCTFHVLAFLSSERSINLDNSTHLIGAVCCLFSIKYNYITQIAKSCMLDKRYMKGNITLIRLQISLAMTIPKKISKHIQKDVFSHVMASSVHTICAQKLFVIN